MLVNFDHSRRMVPVSIISLFAGVALGLFVVRAQVDPANTAISSVQSFPHSNSKLSAMTGNTTSALFNNRHTLPVTESENTASTESKNTASTESENTTSSESENTTSEDTDSSESENTTPTDSEETSSVIQSFYQNISTNYGSFSAHDNDGEDTGQLEDDELPQQPTVSKEDHDRVMAVLDVFTICMEVVSVLLTTTSACVYLSRDMRCTTAVYLVAMNIADAVSGFLVALSSLWARVGGAAAKRTLAYNYMAIVGSLYLSLSARRSLYWLSVIVSLER